MKHLIPLMREQKFGRIINFGSVVPQIGMQGTAAYAGSKSALWGITKVIAKENAIKGITVNTLNLGYFNVGMISEVPEKILNSIVDTIPVKKLGDPKNILNAIKFLIFMHVLLILCRKIALITLTIFLLSELNFMKHSNYIGHSDNLPDRFLFSVSE